MPTNKVTPIAGLLLILLTIFCGNSSTIGPDYYASLAAKSVISERLADIISPVMLVGSSTLTILLFCLAALFLLRRGYGVAALLPGIIFFGIGAEVVLKTMVMHLPVAEGLYRPAPFYPLPHLGSGIEMLKSPFPSGHVMRTTYIALVGLWLVGLAIGQLDLSAQKRRLYWLAANIVAWGLIALQSLLVVHYGWHWTSDAIGGMILGIFCAQGFTWLMVKAARPGDFEDSRSRGAIAPNKSLCNNRVPE